MRELRLWERYTRREVHDIFSPDTVFQPSAGAWGNAGIIRVPDTSGDWVFFVTFGSRQGDHDFDESISEDGVLTWQSQPSQKLEHPRIKQLIEHDDLSHTSTCSFGLRSRCRTRISGPLAT